MQLRQILAVLQKQNKYVTLQRHVARQLIQQRALRLHVMVPSVTNLVRRSNSELVLNWRIRKRRTSRYASFLWYILAINEYKLIKWYFLSEKSNEFLCVLRNNIYLCNVKTKRRWFRTLHIFYCVVLLFYWQGLVEVSAVREYICKMQWYMKPFSLPSAKGFFYGT